MRAGGIVVRAVAGAEIAAELALVLAFAGAQRHAAEMGAHAHRDQPVAVAFLGPLAQRLRIAQAADRHRFGGLDFLRRQVAHEHRLLAEHRLDRLARLDRRDVELGRAFGQHVGRRGHLADQRKQRGDAADAGGADRGDVDEIAAAHAVPVRRSASGSGGACGVCHCLALPAGSDGRSSRARNREISTRRALSEAPRGARLGAADRRARPAANRHFGGDCDRLSRGRPISENWRP